MKQQKDVLPAELAKCLEGSNQCERRSSDTHMCSWGSEHRYRLSRRPSGDDESGISDSVLGLSPCNLTTRAPSQRNNSWFKMKLAF